VGIEIRLPLIATRHGAPSLYPRPPRSCLCERWMLAIDHPLRQPGASFYRTDPTTRGDSRPSACSGLRDRARIAPLLLDAALAGRAFYRETNLTLGGYLNRDLDPPGFDCKTTTAVSEKSFGLVRPAALSG